MRKLFAVLALGVLVAAPSFADENDGKWGVKELKEAQDASLAAFKADKGEDALKSVVGFGIEANLQGVAGNATIIYKTDGVKKSVKYFCHVHEGEGIDCH